MNTSLTETSTVLVVDDNPAHSQALATVFAPAGYQIGTAVDGQDAVKVLRSQPFDLVLTELRMLRMNGLDLLLNIRAKRPQIAVIILTAFGEWSAYMQAMDCGCVDYLNKPVRRDDILLKARKALARRGIRVPTAPVGSSGSPSSAAPRC